MENNIGIKCYQHLLMMEDKNHKINEMIMAPKFAKLLESVDETDINIHKSKTCEFISEFVNESIGNMSEILDDVTELLESVNSNKRLISVCEMKMKLLSKDDRDNFTLKRYNLYNSINESISELYKDMETVSNKLYKILEASFKSKEDYSKIMKNFRNTVSECTSRLDKIDISKMEKTDVSFNEFSSILNEYKNTEVFIENTIDSLSKLINTSELSKSKNVTNNAVKIREAAHLGTEYLMRAEYTMSTLVNALNENNENILCEFVYCETSPETSARLESVIENTIKQNSEDDEDFII